MLVIYFKYSRVYMPRELGVFSILNTTLSYFQLISLAVSGEGGQD